MLHQQEAMNDSRAFELPETRVKQVERHERDSVSTITFPRLFLSMLKVPFFLFFPFVFQVFLRRDSIRSVRLRPFCLFVDE